MIIAPNRVKYFNQFTGDKVIKNFASGLAILILQNIKRSKRGIINKYFKFSVIYKIILEFKVIL